MKKHGRTKKAIEETIRICLDKDVLTEYLNERKVEVMDIMTALFDEIAECTGLPISEIEKLANLLI